MKRSSTVFLQFIIVVIALAVLTFLIWEPHLEGRNANATVFQIYFKDPFLAYAYLGSIAFFTALYQAFRLLSYVAHEKTFSVQSVRALSIIKKCALIIVAFLLGAEAYFFTVVRGTDDIAGGVMLGLMLIFVSSIVATAAAIFEKTLQSAVDLKLENDLTV